MASIASGPWSSYAASRYTAAGGGSTGWSTVYEFGSGPRVPICCAHSLIGAAGWAVVIIEGCGLHVRASSE